MDCLNEVRLGVVIEYSGNKLDKRTELGMNEAWLTGFLIRENCFHSIKKIAFVKVMPFNFCALFLQICKSHWHSKIRSQ